MNDNDKAWRDMRREISERNRRYALDGRLRKFTLAVAGLMAYSAFGNFVGAAMVLSASPIDAVVGIFLGALYSFGLYRVWFKDDLRWWPVAVPAGLTIGWLLLVWWATGIFLPIPIVLNVVLLALVPFRAKATAALVAAAPNSSFKPNPPQDAIDPDTSALSSASDATQGGSA